MTPAALAAHQAAAFHEYRRVTGLEAEVAFGPWAARKGLDDATRHAVWQVVHTELVAMGELSLTDLPEWAGDLGDELDGEDDARAAA